VVTYHGSARGWSASGSTGAKRKQTEQASKKETTGKRRRETA
jgi:hypothetical protein